MTTAPWTLRRTPGTDSFAILDRAAQTFVGVVTGEDYANLAAAAPALLGVLRDLEWDARGGTDYCPACGRTKPEGHDDGCDIAYAIAAAEGKPPS